MKGGERWGRDFVLSPRAATLRKTPWAPASAAWASCEEEQAQAQDARHGCMGDLQQLWSKFEKEREMQERPNRCGQKESERSGVDRLGGERRSDTWTGSSMMS